MPLTVDFKEMVRARAARDPAFRAALFTEAIRELLGGDLETAKIALRAYINATIGFDSLSRVTGTPAKSLMRMFGPKGNPQARHLMAIVAALQKETRVRLEVKASAKVRARAA